MKADIHPVYHNDAKIICVCGNVLTVGSTVPETHVELCSNCHPFYTGKKVLVDTEGRVQKYQKKQAAKEGKSVQTKKEKAAKRATARADKKKAKQPEFLLEA
ncbi:MAG: 50S ribosomal protein L31 [Patescibacteria group bacterium]|nr:50S ribosomal protein L31 [Patescibacteria group bacterium]